MSVETEAIKPLVDAIAVTATASTLFGWLPPIVAILTLLWTAIRIYETETVQKFVEKYNLEDK
jgi:hypothetical protein|tara:strand:+ start:153 stop:341 length:189 start_codon:yes stop_codon:yes gene_type:complete